MTKEYAEKYAAALLRGNRDRDTFEVSFADKKDLYIIAAELENQGCLVEWAKFRHYVTVRKPDVYAVVETDREA